MAEINLEKFRNDLSCVFRSISRDSQSHVEFPLISLNKLSGSYYSDSTQTAFIPFPLKPSKKHFQWARGEVDALALWRRYHDSNLSPDPQSEHHQALERLEEIRVEAIGSLMMTGIAKNLKARWHNRLIEKSYHKLEGTSDIPQSEILALVIYQAIIRGNLPAAAKTIMQHKGKIIEQKITDDLKKLSNLIHDQNAYGNLTAKILNDLQENHDTPKTTKEKPEEAQSKHNDISQNKHKENPPPTSQTLRKQPDSDNDNNKAEQQKSVAELEYKPSNTASPKITNFNRYPYKIYTTEFDQIVHAKNLLDPKQLQKYRKQLDRELDKTQNITNKLAMRLRRLLMAQENCSWQYNMEEGVLDARKFSNIISDPSYPTPYKWEKISENKDTILTILLDNSGSMRGRAITIAAICAEILAKTAECCGAKVEILGFTTQNWKGGKSRKKWEQSGSSNNPGRLNDLLHIIYKDANTPWRISKNGLGLTLKEGLLKENIDGEALLWAHERLSARNEDRKILMVISDGAPIDDSTLAVNNSDYLDGHLKEVIKYIEAEPKTDLLAIGIGHNVTDHYSRSVMISNVDDLADAMVNQLVKLFDDIKTRTKRKPAKTF